MTDVQIFSSQTETNKVEHYVGTLYLSDLSNMLLALHSATNWLIFYNWKARRVGFFYNFFCAFFFFDLTLFFSTVIVKK